MRVWTLVLIAVLGVSACFSYTKRAEQVRVGLIGLPGRALRACLGDSWSVDLEGEVERLTYRWTMTSAWDQEERRIDPDAPEDTRRDPWFEKKWPPDGGQCELVFELTNGEVAAVIATGRTGAGLNADDRCLLYAERCLPAAD